MSFQLPAARPPSLLRLGVFVALTTVLLTVIVFPRYSSGLDLSEGDLAPRTILATKNISYESQVLTNQRREEEAAVVNDVTRFDPTVRTSQLVQLEAILREISNIRQRRDLPVAERRAELAQIEGITLSAQARSAIVDFTDEEWAAVQAEAQRLLDRTLTNSISAEDIEARRLDIPGQIDLGFGGGQSLAVIELTSPLVVPNIVIDEEATEQLREERRRNVVPVRVSYSEGQVIVSEGEAIDAEALEALREAEQIGGPFEAVNFVAVAAMTFLGSLVLAGYFRLAPIEGMENWRRLALITFVIAAAVGAAKLSAPVFLPDTDRQFLIFALPVAAVPMLLTSLFGLGLGVMVAPLLAVLVTFAAIYAPNFTGSSLTNPLESFELISAFAFAGLIGTFVVHRAERLGRYAAAGLAVFTATWAVLMVFWLLDGGRLAQDVAWITVVSGLNGLLSSVIAVGAFVMLAMMFGITTRLQLMELAQVTHPLLRKLQEEAPGTFHHSMVVGNLAERAAYEIGADALLVRVGAYYHDIGKTVRPSYFIENQFSEAGNPHDLIDPLESARIIAEHTREGLDLAKKHRLPDAVRDFIPQHHGTRLVTYFYRKAAQRDPDVDPKYFQYPGPKPQTREAAIVMLADSCEAVVRSSQDRAPDRIDKLVDGVIGERLAEGQLDECNITMRDLRKVAQAFKNTLAAIYHERIEYPEPTEAERERTRIAEATLSGIPMDGSAPPSTTTGIRSLEP